MFLHKIFLPICLIFLALSLAASLTALSRGIVQKRTAPQIVLLVCLSSLASLMLMTSSIVARIPHDFLGCKLPFASPAAEMAFAFLPVLGLLFVEHKKVVCFISPVVLVSALLISVFRFAGSAWAMLSGMTVVLSVLAVLVMIFVFRIVEMFLKTGKMFFNLLPDVMLHATLNGTFPLVLLFPLVACEVTESVLLWCLMQLVAGFLVCDLCFRQIFGRWFFVNGLIDRFFMKSMKEAASLYMETHPDHELKKLYDRILVYLETEKRFLRSEFCLDDMVKDLYSNRSYVSKAIATFSDVDNFCQLLNKFRVRHSIMLFSNDTTLRVGDLAQLSGFNSATTYSTAFKMFMNMYPKDWCRQVRLERGIENAAVAESQVNESSEGTRKARRKAAVTPSKRSLSHSEDI